jgi:predicted O-methyltransferase YrrM
MTSRTKAFVSRLLGRAGGGEESRKWAATDRYVCDRLGLKDAATESAVEAIHAAGMPPIGVAATEGKMLELLGRIVGARRILELGTLGGYSTIWLARSLPPDGRIVTIEYQPRYAEVARANIAAAGLTERVDQRVGAALDVLPELEGGEPFDLIFIDADKGNYSSYIDWALKLSRPGTLIVADNVIGGGAIAEADGHEPWGEEGGLAGVRRLYERLGTERRLQTTAIQTVGEKGYDGFALALVTEPPADG